MPRPKFTKTAQPSKPLHGRIRKKNPERLRYNSSTRKLTKQQEYGGWGWKDRLYHIAMAAKNTLIPIGLQWWFTSTALAWGFAPPLYVSIPIVIFLSQKADAQLVPAVIPPGELVPAVIPPACNMTYEYGIIHQRGPTATIFIKCINVPRDVFVALSVSGSGEIGGDCVKEVMCHNGDIVMSMIKEAFDNITTANPKLRCFRQSIYEGPDLYRLTAQLCSFDNFKNCTNGLNSFTFINNTVLTPVTFGVETCSKITPILSPNAVPTPATWLPYLKDAGYIIVGVVSVVGGMYGLYLLGKKGAEEYKQWQQRSQYTEIPDGSIALQNVAVAPTFKGDAVQVTSN